MEKTYSAMCTIKVQEGYDPRDILDQIAQRILDMPELGLLDISFSEPTDAKVIMWGPIK